LHASYFFEAIFTLLEVALAPIEPPEVSSPSRAVMSAKRVVEDLKDLACVGKAAELQRFFKTGPGEYGEGDIFIGLAVPQMRKVAALHQSLPLSEIAKLTKSEIHEVRLCGLIILTNQFKKCKEISERETFFNFYLKELKAGNVNNWDLVDVAAPTLGECLLHLEDPMAVLNRLAKSKSLWQRRASVVFTFAFLRSGNLEPTYEIAEQHLGDQHDLMHKAVGWLLREMGKRDPDLLRAFLKEHCAEMPRTALRYSIEKFSESERRKWLLTK
jgi:3-methyladenine DNA glycosylase AlkD